MHHNKSMYITNVENEGPFLKIWGQTDKKASLEVEEALLRASERFEEGHFKIKPDSLEVGILCCAKYMDEKYYRARVTNIEMVSDGMVEVNFLDYGNKDIIPASNLRSPECFSSSFISLPPLSSPFILAEVVCVGGVWNDRILELITKEVRYIETTYVIVAQAIRYFFIKVFVHDVDLGLHLVRRNFMQSTSVQTQEAVLLAMIPIAPQTPPNQSLLQYKSFTLEANSQHEVYVSFITDGPCHFSVQLKKYETTLAQLMREINSIPLKSLDELPIPGTVCLAKCVDDNQICRAVVTSEVDSQYKLFYVDFGNTELVPPENLYQMAFKYIIPKIMAIRLSLEGIEKSTMTIEMQCAFKQFVDNRLLLMEVLPSTKKMSLPRCRMWDPDTNTDVLEVLNRAAKCAYPDPIPLHKGFTQLVKVSFVYSCNRFFIQLKSKESDLDKLMVELQTYCNSNQTSFLDKAKVGQPCCALFSFDSQWYRSQITEINGELAKVRYIDYGNEENVPIDTLKLVEGEYLTVLRPQAIECCLNGYQNMAEDQDRDNKLEELILEQDFTMRVIDTINNKTLVELSDATNTNVTVLLLESIIAQSKIQNAPPPPERFDRAPNQGLQRIDSPVQKSYFQHDDRRPPRNSDRREKQDDTQIFRNSDRREKQDDSNVWRQNTRKQSDSNSNESAESWRNDSKGFKNQKETDWNERPSTDNFRKEKDFKRKDTAGGGERLPRPRNQNGDWGSKEETWNQNKSRNQNEDWTSKDNRSQNKPQRNTNSNWGDSNSKKDDWGDSSSKKNNWGDNDSKKEQWGDSNSKKESWGDRNQGYKKRDDMEKSDWGGSSNRGPRNRDKPGNDDWGNKNSSKVDDWADKNSSKNDDWGNTNSTKSGDWGGKKGFKDRNAGGDNWGDNKGNTERRFGDRNRDNDRGGFKKKSYNREGSEVGSSGSEKSFGKGFRTSSRNDSRPPRQGKKFDNKASDNSWNVSQVPSVIDAAPNNAVFKPIDVSGRNEKVSISWFHNPCNFFCQLVESQEAFKNLMQDLQNTYKDRPAGSCVDGAPCVALFPEDSVLYRGRIVEIIDSQYKVHYVDFGNVSLVDKVWPIEKKFMDLPMQAIACGFGGIEPIGDDWPNPDTFSKYFGKEDIECNFSNIDNGRFLVSLCSENQNICQQLVDDSLVQYSQSSVIDFEIDLFVGQQLHAMLQIMNNLSDFTMVLQSGIVLMCSLHNLASATETNEEILKQQEGQILIVYVDNLVNDRLEVTLYDLTGTKLNVIAPDDGAFDTVETLCPYLVTKSIIQGFVSHVNETSVVIQPSECAPNLEYLLEQMYEYYKNLPHDNPLIPEEEFVYAVRSEDENWYRGRVTSFDDAKASVVYVDYGNSEEVEFSSLRELTNDFMMWDALAILVNVKVPTADFLDQDVTATIYYAESSWEGELELIPPTHQPVETVINTTESSVQFTEVSTEEPSQEQEIAEISTIPSVDNTVVNDEACSSGVENEITPSGGTSVVLSHIDSPSDFYIQLVDSLTAIDELQLKIQEKVEEMSLLESASVGGLCAAPYSLDQQWYRSQILDADDDITTVRFIDYGNTDVIDNATTQIKTLPPEFLSLEEYATRCRLKIKPNEEEWSKAATDRFEALTSVSALTVEFVDQDEKTHYVEIYSDGTNVKDVLLAENLAVPDGATFEVKLTGFVSHMNSPSEFWMQLESCCAELEWIAEQLSSAESFPDLEDLTPGSLCAAMFPDDEMWYRARILSNTVAGLEVLFLDYGNSCVCSSLKQLPEHLVMAPPLAQKCALQKPEGLMNWSSEAAQKFTDLSADGQTVFTVKKLTTGETSVVELLVNGEDVASKLLPSTDNGYVTDVESLESFTVSKDGAVADADASEERLRLEKVPGAEFNEECLKKFVELNNEGKTVFAVEYLADSTVRLYLDGCDIRNYFKDFLFNREISPIPSMETSEALLHKPEDLEQISVNKTDKLDTGSVIEKSADDNIETCIDENTESHEESKDQDLNKENSDTVNYQINIEKSEKDDVIEENKTDITKSENENNDVEEKIPSSIDKKESIEKKENVESVNTDLGLEESHITEKSSDHQNLVEEECSSNTEIKRTEENEISETQDTIGCEDIKRRDEDFNEQKTEENEIYKTQDTIECEDIKRGDEKFNEQKSTKHKNVNPEIERLTSPECQDLEIDNKTCGTQENEVVLAEEKCNIKTEIKRIDENEVSTTQDTTECENIRSQDKEFNDNKSTKHENIDTEIKKLNSTECHDLKIEESEAVLLNENTIVQQNNESEVEKCEKYSSKEGEIVNLKCDKSAEIDNVLNDENKNEDVITGSTADVSPEKSETEVVFHENKDVLFFDNEKKHSSKDSVENFVQEETKVDDSEPSDITQSSSSLSLQKSKDDKSITKLEFNEEILTSFPAPTVSENVPTIKISPTKVIPTKSQDS